MIAQLKEVTKVYRKKEGVRGVSFQVSPGDAIGLMGVNGSGKSTTLKLLAGLLLPTSGTVEVGGTAPRHSRHRIAYLAEHDDLYPWMGFRDAICFMEGFFPDFRRERFTRLVELLEVPPQKAQAMSEGQRGRLRLAMCLAREADLFLLDEPLSGIDMISREKILKALVSEWRNHASIILSTHEVEEAEGIFNRAIYLREGEIILDVFTEKLKAEGKTVAQAFREVLA